MDTGVLYLLDVLSVRIGKRVVLAWSRIGSHFHRGSISIVSTVLETSEISELWGVACSILSSIYVLSLKG
jgi:hypothetical protein